MIRFSVEPHNTSCQLKKKGRENIKPHGMLAGMPAILKINPEDKTVTAIETRDAHIIQS